MKLSRENGQGYMLLYSWVELTGNLDILPYTLKHSTQASLNLKYHGKEQDILFQVLATTSYTMRNNLKSVTCPIDISFLIRLLDTSTSAKLMVHNLSLQGIGLQAYIKHIWYQFYQVVKYCMLQIAHSQNHIVFIGHMNKITAHLSQN